MAKKVSGHDREIKSLKSGMKSVTAKVEDLCKESKDASENIEDFDSRLLSIEDKIANPPRYGKAFLILMLIMFIQWPLSLVLLCFI